MKQPKLKRSNKLIEKELKQRRDHLKLIQDMIDELVKNKESIRSMVISVHRNDIIEDGETYQGWAGSWNECVGLSYNLIKYIEGE